MKESEYQKKLLSLRASKQQAGVRKQREKEIVPVQRNEDTLFRASPSQQRIVRLLVEKPEMAEAYNIPIAFWLTGDLQVEMLRCAVEEAVRVNEVLRTVFVIKEDRVAQAIGKKSADLELVDFAMTGEESEQKLAYLIRECSVQPFSLFEGPLIRFKLFCMEKRYVFCIVASHLITDGWSIGILLREISKNYSLLVSGKPIMKKKNQIQYADYVEWQYNWKGSNSYNKQFDYWMKKLKEWKKPFVFRQYEERFQKDIGSCFTFTIPKEVTQIMNSYVRQHQGSVYVTLLTSYISLLYKYTKEPYIVIASPNANRGNAQVDEVLGFFVNDFVLSNYLGDKPTYGELYQRVYETSLEAVSNGDIPLEDYYNRLLPNVDKHKMIQVKFNYRKEENDTVFYNLNMEDYKIPGRLATSNFNFIAVEKEDEIHCSIEFNKRYFEESFIENFKNELIACLVNLENSFNKRID